MVAYLITGVNRGIGFALVDQLSQDKSNIVIGTVRDVKKAQDIADLKRSNLHLIEVDFAADQDTVSKAFKKIDEFAPKGLDTVIHSAGAQGISVFTPFDDYKADDYLLPFKINLVGSVKLYKAVSPYLYKGEGPKKFGFISSVAGQLTSEWKFQGYGLSKAAVNYFMRQLYSENKNSENPLKKNSVVVSIHPGFVETEMSREAVELGIYKGVMDPISPNESAEGILKVLSTAKTGAFVSYDGSVLDL